MDNYRDSYSEGVESLWTVAEIAYENFEVMSTEILQGYFRAPASGKFRFLMSCEDQCRQILNYDPVYHMENDLTHATMIIERTTGTTFRDLFDAGSSVRDENMLGVQYSEWIELIGGEYYYFETQVMNEEDEFHVSIGMEVNPDEPIEGHPNSGGGQIQTISMGFDFRMDTTQLRIQRADSNYFILDFINHNLDRVRSENLYSYYTAEEFESALNGGYYRTYFGVDPVVTKTFWTIHGI